MIRTYVGVISEYLDKIRKKISHLQEFLAKSIFIKIEFNVLHGRPYLDYPKIGPYHAHYDESESIHNENKTNYIQQQIRCYAHEYEISDWTTKYKHSWNWLQLELPGIETGDRLIFWARHKKYNCPEEVNYHRMHSHVPDILLSASSRAEILANAIFSVILTGNTIEHLMEALASQIRQKVACVPAGRLRAEEYEQVLMALCEEPHVGQNNLFKFHYKQLTVADFLFAKVGRVWDALCINPYSLIQIAPHVWFIGYCQPAVHEDAVVPAADPV
jgi:hypothetical protein